MVSDDARVPSRVRNVLIGWSVAALVGLVLAMVPRPWIAAGEAAGVSTDRGALLILVRTGLLARDEVSPGSRGPARQAWQLALGGTTWTQLASSPAMGGRTVDSLVSELFPVGSVKPTVLDLAEGEELPGDVYRGPEGTALPLRDLETLFGSIDEPSVGEATAIAGLARALGSASSGGSRPTGAVSRLQARARLQALAKSPASLVRVVAEGSSTAEVERRDALLSAAVRAVGTSGHLVVVNLPAAGDGSVFFRGPRFREGWIVETRVRLDAVRAVAARLRGEADPEQLANTDEEALRELFR